MKKNLIQYCIATLLVAVAMISCEKEGSSPNGRGESGDTSTKHIVAFNNRHFVWDGEHLRKLYTEFDTMYFYYDGDRLTSWATHSKYLQNDTVVLTYWEGKVKVLEESFWDSYGDYWEHEDVLYYNSDGDVVKIESTETGDFYGTDELHNTTLFEWADGNVVWTKTPTMEISYEHDNNICWTRGIPSILLLVGSVFIVNEDVGINNCIGYTATYFSNSGRVNDKSQQSYTYTYDKEGFPVQRCSKSGVYDYFYYNK